MAAELEGARVKVQRAKEHLSDFATRMQEFNRLNPYGVVIDENPETGERIWRARVSRDIPLEWGLIVGEIVHTLRASLDYLAYQLWIKNGGRIGSREEAAIQFPVVNDLNRHPGTHEYETERPRKVRTFGETAVALIDRLQPDPRRYQGDLTLQPLYLLHRLDIWDKHRRLNVVGGTVQMTNMTLGGGEHVHIDSMAIGGGDVRTVPIADGTELFRLTLGRDTPNVQMEQKFGFYIAFEQGGPGKGEPVIDTLNQLIGFVDQTLTVFAPLF